MESVGIDAEQAARLFHVPMKAGAGGLLFQVKSSTYSRYGSCKG